MKNFSKNNYSKRDRNNTKISPKSDNSYKTNNNKDKYKSNKNNPNRNDRNHFMRIDRSKNSDSDFFKSGNNKKNNLQQQQRFSNKVNYESFTDKKTKNNTLTTNNKNLEDWIWGKHSVLASLNSERPINRVWCTSDIFSSEKFYLLLKNLKSRGVLIEEVSWARLSQLTFGAVHQGIALQLASSQTIPLSELIDLSKKNSSYPIIVALDGITDPHNLGAIIRSAEAFDCKGIVIPQRRSAGLTGTVAKVAAGALAHIPVSRVTNLNRALDELKKNGFTVLGLAAEGQIPVSDFNEKIPLVVIVGAENKGISLITQKHCDYLMKIPLKGKTSSLNASVAAAISLFHLSN